MHDVTVRPRCSSKIIFPGAIAIAVFWSERPWLRSGGRRLAGSAGLIQASGQQSRHSCLRTVGRNLCLNGAWRTRLNILQPDPPHWHLCLGGLLSVARAGSGFIFPEYSRIASCRLRVASGAVADIGNHGGPFSGPNVRSGGSCLACLNGAYADARRPLGLRTKLSPGS